MDDLVVIILTLIFIVAGIFGQMKKKRAAPEPHAESKPQEDNFWNLLDREWEDTGQPAEKPQEMQEVQEEKPVPKKDSRFDPNKEGARVFRDDLTKKKQVKPGKKKKFPLREAVIYSEILHRKYN